MSQDSRHHFDWFVPVSVVALTMSIKGIESMRGDRENMFGIEPGGTMGF